MTQPPTFQPPYQPQPTPVTPPPATKKPHLVNRIVTSRTFIALLAFLIGISVGGMGKTSTQAAPAPAATVTVAAPAGDAAPAPTVTQTVTVTAPPAAPAPAAPPAITDGTYLVGSEIALGNWKSDGSGTGLCYADTQDQSGKILQQEVGQAGESVVVRIQKGAYTFKSSDCGGWTKVG